MNDASSPTHPRSLPLLVALFAGSGCAALIYQIAWFQVLELIIGSSAVSLAVLLGTFMGGMGLGNFLVPRLVSPTRNPIRVWVMLELGIAVGAIVALFAMSAIGRITPGWLDSGKSGTAWRAIACVACLLPPTMLMGATLPVVARWLEATRERASWLGFLYAGSTVGAVAGCLLTGFYLLRVHDPIVATWCAVAVNVTVALVALAIAKDAPVGIHAENHAATATAPSSVAWVVLGSIALSGFCALSAEVIWTRMLSLMFGATVYTFSVILAVFLTGLGLGSFAGAALARRSTQPRRALGWCQLLQVLAIVWASDLLARTLPLWPTGNLPDASLWIRYQSDLLRSACVLLPAASLWGASFPLAVAAGVTASDDPAKNVSQIYAANTTGAIAGAVLTSLLLLPRFGTPWVEGLLIVLSIGAALLVLRPSTIAGRLGLAAATAVGIWLAATPLPVPWQLVAYGRRAADGDQTANILYLGEGANATVAVSQNWENHLFFHISGKTEASTRPKDMRLQRMLGHLPALLHPQPRSVLIVGCGAGVTAGSFVVHPSVERIVICEIEPLIPQRVAPYFHEENHDVLRDPRVTVVYDDARHFMATTREKFDVITSDPIHPWVKGAAALYSVEYFSLCAQHLNPGGIVTQWVPFYQSSAAVVQSELATFFSVFPYGTVWGNDDAGQGYDSVVIGQAAPLTIDVDGLQARLDRSDHASVRQSLADVGFDSGIALLATYSGSAANLESWLQHAEKNQDRSLRLQYLAGLSSNSNAGRTAYAELLGQRRFPTELFRASPPVLTELQRRLQPPATSR